MKQLEHGREEGFYVYAVEISHAGESWTKIGQAADLGSRLSGIQSGCPFPITSCMYLWFPHPGGLPVDRYSDLIEQTAHSVLERHTRRGEWFSCRAGEELLADIIAAVRPICAHDIEWKAYSFVRREKALVSPIEHVRDKIIARAREYEDYRKTR